MFKLENVSKKYSQGEQSLTALSGLKLEIGQVGFVSVVGDSGSGKTTLLNLLAGFDKYNEGKIFFEDKDMSLFSEEEWNSYYSEEVGFVFQEYNVIEEFTVWENIELPLKILDISNEKKQEIINAALVKVGIEDIKHKKINKLSGGQKQRVAIARAYVKAPKVILADEPTGNLDSENSIRVFEMLKDISKDILVVIVTHDDMLAKKYSDRIIRLCDGVISLDSTLTGETYKVFLSDKNCEVEITNFDDIIEFIKLHTNDEIEYTLNVKRTENKSSSLSMVRNERVHYKKRKISLKEIVILAKKILEKRRIRYILSTAIFILTNFLMLIFIDFAFYNEDNVVCKYLKKYNDKYVLVERQLDNLLGNKEDGNTAYVTKEIKEDLFGVLKDAAFFQFDLIEFTNDDKLINLDEYEEKQAFSVVCDGRVLSDWNIVNRVDTFFSRKFSESTDLCMLPV